MRNELDAIIDDYLEGKLSSDEVQAFEALRKNDPVLDQKVIEQQAFLAELKKYSEQAALQHTLDELHTGIDVVTLADNYRPKPALIISLWRKNQAAITVAAMFIILSAIGLNFYKFYTQHDDNEQVRRELQNIKSSQNNLIRDIRSKNVASVTNPGKYGGTGFALSSNGYICTNYHVIKDADSVYVQNNDGESFKVQVAFSDQQNDIAILKIVDAGFVKLPSLPYALKTTDVGLGEIVYTLGFPKDDAVLGEGYVSSKSGFGGDTTLAYQVSLPVNPGNSGGPLLDNNGNVIGMISSKAIKSDGAAFSIKSKYIVDALRAIPSDSLSNKISKIKKTRLSGLNRTRQVEKIQDYVFMVRVY